MARGQSDDNAEILAYALKHLEKERDEIQARIDNIRRQLGRSAGRRSAPTAVPSASRDSAPERKKRILSEAARKRIAAAQKRRWAEHRKEQQVKSA